MRKPAASFNSPSTSRRPGTRHAAHARGQVCPAPPPASRVLAGPSQARARPDFRTPSGSPGPSPRVWGASPDKGRKASLAAALSLRRPRPRTSGLESPANPTPTNAPGGPPTPPRGSPPPASRRSLGSHPARARAHPSSSPQPPGLAELPGSLPHT